MQKRQRLRLSATSGATRRTGSPLGVHTALRVGAVQAPVQPDFRNGCERYESRSAMASQLTNVAPRRSRWARKAWFLRTVLSQWRSCASERGLGGLSTSAR